MKTNEIHGMPSEMTPIPAVANEEFTRVIAELRELAINFGVNRGSRKNVRLLGYAADLLQRAQADAANALRYRWLIENSNIETIENESGVGFWWKANANPSNNPDWNTPEKFAARIDAALRTSSPDPVVPRGEDVNYCCHACWREIRPSPILDRMILCDVCGNKRCPKANDHRNACTNSNEPGQKGSACA